MPEPTDRKALADLLEQGGTWTVAYIDGHSALPQGEEEAMQDTTVNRLEDMGAPAADVAAVKAALPGKAGIPSPSTRYLLVHDGEVVLDETFPGPRFGPERVGFGPVPEILPLLRHTNRSVCYLIIETGREGAEVRLERADQHAPEEVEMVEGRDDSLKKVQAGGWSHARFQRSAEEVWKHNQAEVADVVERLVDEHAPAFVVLAGDVRARQMLTDRLGERVTRILVEVDTHTKPDGANHDAVDTAVAKAHERYVCGQIDDAIDRASTDSGSSGARGVSEVVEALQQARVDTLVLDARLVDDSRTLHALDAEPWIAETQADGLDASSLGELPVAEALARAATLTGATVLIREQSYESADEPRAEPDPMEPIASLRWPDEAPAENV